MIVLIVLAAQTGAVAGPPAPLPARLPARVRITRPCPAPEEDGGDVVVCGRSANAERYRFRPLPTEAERTTLPRARTRVFGNATMSGETEAASVGGFVSNRAMVRLKVPF